MFMIIAFNSSFFIFLYGVFHLPINKTKQNKKFKEHNNNKKKPENSDRWNGEQALNVNRAFKISFVFPSSKTNRKNNEKEFHRFVFFSFWFIHFSFAWNDWRGVCYNHLVGRTVSCFSYFFFLLNCYELYSHKWICSFNSYFFFISLLFEFGIVLFVFS